MYYFYIIKKETSIVPWYYLTRTTTREVLTSQDVLPTS